jgi:hypothetical protein
MQIISEWAPPPLVFVTSMSKLWYAFLLGSVCTCCKFSVLLFNLLNNIRWRTVITNLLITLPPSVLWHFSAVCKYFRRTLFTNCVTEVHVLNEKDKHIFSLIVKYCGGRHSTWYTSPKNCNWHELRFSWYWVSKLWSCGFVTLCGLVDTY